MYKLNLGIGFSILQLIYLPHCNKTCIIDIIEQHRIILSNKIISYYEENVDDNYKEILDTFLDSIVYTDESHIFYQSDENDKTALEEMVDLVNKNPMKIIVSEEEEFGGISLCKAKIINSKAIIDKEINALYRFSFPITHHFVKIGSSCEAYSTWFGHLFESEKHIKIIDKYIVTDNGLKSLKKYYFPNIPDSAEVDIYCKRINNISDEEILNYFNDNYFKSWQIRVYLCKKMHERFIEFGDCQISIGSGLDFLHYSGVTQKDCIIGITNDRKYIECCDKL